MADTQILKFTGNVDSEKRKWNNYSVKTAKTFTELEAKLTHNFIARMEVFTDEYAENFNFLYRGKFTKAIGDGLRFIQTYGTQQVVEHTPPKSGDTLSLKVPYELQERTEVLKNYFRLKCAAKANDILAGADIWIDPDQMYEFQRQKIGDVEKSLRLYVFLLWHYILISDPWAKEHTDFLLSWGVTTRLGTKWTDSDLVGQALTLMKEKVTQEFEKEKNLKNVINYSLVEWLPRKLEAGEIAKKKRKNKPTAELDKSKLVKMYFTNSDIDPVLYVCALCRMIDYHASRMFTWTSENDSQFPGNDKNEQKKYGASKDNFQYFCKCNPEDFVIIMNNELLLLIKEFDLISTRTEVGAYIGFIKKILKYKIIGLESMPYGCIKMGSKYRYNHWLLYDKILTDTMGWEDFKMWTLHQGMLIGIREHVPFCCLRITDLYMNPAVSEKIDVTPDSEAL